VKRLLKANQLPFLTGGLPPAVEQTLPMSNGSPPKSASPETSLPTGKATGLIGSYIANLRLFSRNIWLYLGMLFLLNLNLQVFLAMFNLYMNALGFAEGDVGQAIASRQAGAAFFAIPIAILMSKVSMKKVLAGACLLLAVASFALVQTSSNTLIMIFSFLCGVSFSAAGIASGPFFMDNTSPAERAHVFSMSFGVHLIAGIIGSISSGHIVAYFGSVFENELSGYRTAFYLTVLSALLAIVPLAVIRMTHATAASALVSFQWRGFFTRMSKQMKLLSAHFLVATGAGLSIPFINLYFSQRFGLSTSEIGTLFGLMQIFMLVGTLSSPFMAQRWGLVRSIVFTQLISIPFLLILAHGYIIAFAIAAFFLRAGFMNSAVPIIGTLGMEVSRPEDRPMMQALVSTVWGAAWMISALVGGHLIESHGYAVTMDITVVLYACATALFYIMFRSLEKRSTSGGPQWVLVDEEA
jgi:predicted MFS family arabinose efflux permease